VAEEFVLSQKARSIYYESNLKQYRPLTYVFGRYLQANLKDNEVDPIIRTG